MPDFRKFIVTPVLACLLFVGVLRADQPLEKPQRNEFFSTHHKYGAVSDIQPLITTVFRIDAGGKRIPVWAIPGWFRLAAVSDDGEHLLIGYSGVNLIPLSEPQPLETVILVDYLQGKKVQTIQLKELLSRLEMLKKTASHYSWGEYQGWVSPQQYQIHTVDGQTWVYDIQTKKVLKKGL
jgi:hypothetical protein